MKISEKENRLKNIIRGFDSALVSLSGGVDSSLLASVTHEVLEDEAISVTAKSETLPSWNAKRANKVAEEIGIKHFFLETEELENQNFKSNPSDRCYYCKVEHLQKLNEFREKRGIEKILDGTNKSDLEKDRPGIKAIEEFEDVVSTPLAEANLNKKEVRKLAEIRKLSVAQNPSTTCLATRVPKNDNITVKKLNKVEKAEKYLHSFDFKNLRVRNHGGDAIIELKKDEIEKLMRFRNEVSRYLKELGFDHTYLDLEGRSS